MHNPNQQQTPKNLLILVAFLGFLLHTPSASSQPFLTVDIVKVNAAFEKEAMYFYEKNWLAFRKEALKQKVISGYELIRSATDSTNFFTLTLITRYKNKKFQQQSEARFRPIMNKISPGGPLMLNTVSRKEFLNYVTGSDGEVVHQD